MSPTQHEPTPTHRHRIVVLGAGYSGAFAAGRLARRLSPSDVQVTVVNAEPDFVERIRMHQLATGQSLRVRPLTELLAGTGAEVVVGRVTSLDPDAATVQVVAADGPTELGYDTLVYALGSAQDDGGVPGVAEHADQVAGRPGALRLRERLGRLGAGGRVVVVGGGLTGIEAVTEIAEARPDLDVCFVVRGPLGNWLSPSGRRHLASTLQRLGVEVHDRTDVARVLESGVETSAGALIAAEVTVWAGGFRADPLPQATTLSLTDQGRIVVDETMRSVSHPDVYAVGDAAQATGPLDNPLRMSCASGMPMAWRAADAIVARLTGARPLPVTLRYVHQCISLGRSDGLIQLVTADDQARPLAVGGRLAARYKEWISAGAALAVAHPAPAARQRRTTHEARSQLQPR